MDEHFGSLLFSLLRDSSPHAKLVGLKNEVCATGNIGRVFLGRGIDDEDIVLIPYLKELIHCRVSAGYSLVDNYGLDFGISGKFTQNTDHPLLLSYEVVRPELIDDFSLAIFVDHELSITVFLFVLRYGIGDNGNFPF